MRTISTVQVTSAIRDAYSEGLDFDGADDGADGEGFDPGATVNEDRTLDRVFAISDLQNLHQRLAHVEAQLHRTRGEGRKSPWYRVKVGHRLSLLAQIRDAQARVDGF